MLGVGRKARRIQRRERLGWCKVCSGDSGTGCSVPVLLSRSRCCNPKFSLHHHPQATSPEHEQATFQKFTLEVLLGGRVE